MKITNHYGLPKSLVRLMETSTYSRGKSKMSVTQLISPPRIVQLQKKHDDDIEVDVSDMIWLILGTAVHKILEIGGDETHLPEERLFAKVKDWDISGALDLQIVGLAGGRRVVDIVDYKNTSVWSVIFGKPEWEAQMNCYAWLVTTTKEMFVSKLRIVAFLRDWQRRDADQDKDYPQHAVQEIDVPRWSYEDATRYIEERVEIHQQAEMAAVFDEPLPECTEEERWTRGSNWAVMFPSLKRAKRVFPDGEAGENEARTLALQLEQQDGKSYPVVRRIGEHNRCKGNYCRVAPWCDQWQSEG